MRQYGGLHSEYIAPSTGELLDYEAQYRNVTSTMDMEIIWALCAPLTLSPRIRMDATLATTIVRGAIDTLRANRRNLDYNLQDVINTMDRTYRKRRR